MIPVMTYLLDVALVLFIAREVVQFARRYDRLKQEIAAGDPDARSRLYRRVLRFQWLSAFFALTALRMDWNALRPQSLGLASFPLVTSFARNLKGGLGGIAVGVAVGTLGLIALRLRSRHAGSNGPRRAAPIAGVRRLLPDFGAVLPVTARERWLWLAVSIGAGVCEEIVFRGWLLSVLHAPLGLAGAALILVAAGCFGLAHAYQGPAGVLLTGLAGVLFCVLYVATGGLLVPIVLHTIIDARFALLPRGEAESTTGSPAFPGLRAI